MTTAFKRPQVCFHCAFNNFQSPWRPCWAVPSWLAASARLARSPQHLHPVGQGIPMACQARGRKLCMLTCSGCCVFFALEGSTSAHSQISPQFRHWSYHADKPAQACLDRLSDLLLSLVHLFAHQSSCPACSKWLDLCRGALCLDHLIAYVVGYGEARLMSIN